jgi:hypothetical protein
LSSGAKTQQTSYMTCHFESVLRPEGFERSAF